jgi:hypothetical protein
MTTGQTAGSRSFADPQRRFRKSGSMHEVRPTTHPY